MRMHGFVEAGSRIPGTVRPRVRVTGPERGHQTFPIRTAVVATWAHAKGGLPRAFRGFEDRGPNVHVCASMSAQDGLRQSQIRQHP